MGERRLDCIELSGLEVDCVVGTYPRERHVPQPLRVDLQLFLDTERAARKESLAASLDYAATAAQLGFLLRSCEFRMLETAAHALARYLLAPPAPGERRMQVERVSVRLTKPFALAALGKGQPSLRIERERSWADMRTLPEPYGSRDVICETKDVGIYRVNIAPFANIPLHVHQRMRRAELSLSAGLFCQQKPMPAGTTYRWPLGAAHSYDNPTSRYQTLLRVESPRLGSSDEVVVDGEPAHVEPEPGPADMTDEHAL